MQNRQEQEAAATDALEAALLAVERELRVMGNYFMGDIDPDDEEEHGAAMEPDCDLLDMLIPMLRALGEERVWWQHVREVPHDCPEYVTRMLRLNALLAMVEAFQRYQFSGDAEGSVVDHLLQAGRALDDLQAITAPVVGEA
jgi:hypothetical protein